MHLYGRLPVLRWQPHTLLPDITANEVMLVVCYKLPQLLPPRPFTSKQGQGALTPGHAEVWEYAQHGAEVDRAWVVHSITSRMTPVGTLPSWSWQHGRVLG